MATEILPFADEHLGAAAALPAESHERHLAAEPLLGRPDESLALAAFVVRWARERGFRSSTTNRGWRTTYLRLYRAIP